MIIGVFYYSLTIGSLATLLSSLDSSQNEYNKKFNTLVEINNNFTLNSDLFQRIKKSLKYPPIKTDEKILEFLANLPTSLRIETGFNMYINYVYDMEFFKSKSKRFISSIGPHLKLLRFGKDEFIYSEGEHADEMFFIKFGSVSMVIKEFNNLQFITIQKGYYFGEV